MYFDRVLGLIAVRAIFNNSRKTCKIIKKTERKIEEWKSISGRYIRMAKRLMGDSTIGVACRARVATRLAKASVVELERFRPFRSFRRSASNDSRHNEEEAMRQTEEREEMKKTKIVENTRFQA